jgi:hypothetical protein
MTANSRNSARDVVNDSGHDDSRSPEHESGTEEPVSADHAEDLERLQKTRTLRLNHHRTSFSVDSSEVEGLVRKLSRRTTETEAAIGEEDSAVEHLEKIMGNIFGRSDADKRKHVGVIWKHLTVRALHAGN